MCGFATQALSSSQPSDLLSRQSESAISGGGWNMYDGDCEPADDGFIVNGHNECAYMSADVGDPCYPGDFTSDCSGQMSVLCESSWIWDSCVLGESLPVTNCPEGVKLYCPDTPPLGASNTLYNAYSPDIPVACGSYETCP